MSGFVGVAMIAAFTLCFTPPAHADKHHRKHKPADASQPAVSAAGQAGDAPWATGISKSHQKQAFELFDAGNALFEEGKYTDAIVEYQKAIEKWDHPNIEFNLAVCLFNISKPLDAWDHLEVAMQYGEAPLGKRVYEQALTYRALLESSLAQLEVSSDQDDVVVVVDGRELFTGKATKSLHLLAGKHELVATRDGYETESHPLDLPAGALTQKKINLQPEKVKITVKRENYERRWAWWVPWATVGTGVGLALIGTGVYLAARSDIHAYDAALAQNCPMGCTPAMIAALPGSLPAQEAHARLVSQVGIGFWTAGAVVALAAGTMAILNRPQLEVEGHPADVAIVATPGYVGASFALTFR